jgi:hypothetical protein
MILPPSGRGGARDGASPQGRGLFRRRAEAREHAPRDRQGREVDFVSVVAALDACGVCATPADVQQTEHSEVEHSYARSGERSVDRRRR